MPIYAVFADTIPDSVKSAWGYSNFDTNNGDVGEFIIDGGIGEHSKTGNWDCKSFDKANQTASKGVVGVVAQRIVEHGGYFCPSQVQCDSRNRGDSQKVVWFSWYTPDKTGGIETTEEDKQKDKDEGKFVSKKYISACQWLCDDGYAGAECKPISGASYCQQNIIFTKPGTDGSVYGTLSMSQNETGKTKNKDCNVAVKIDSQIPYFEHRSNPAKGVVLGVTKFLQHGVIVAPIKLECAKRNNERAWLSSVSLADGKPRVLCAAGYRPENGDCVVINQTVCDNPNMEYCEGFPAAGYRAEEHVLNMETGCIKYFCADETKAFASATDRACTVDCAQDIRSGVDSNTGMCKICETGKYFNSKKNDCDTADVYTRDNLRYGKDNKTKSQTISNQCWTKFSTEYKQCVSTR